MEARYLGDGVYASFDGYNIWLARTDHDNKLIALEPEVMQALKKYEEEINKEIEDGNHI